MKSERGQAMTEMALIIPLLLVFILGAVEFSNLLMTALKATSLSREAANASFRDCAFLDNVAANTCLEDISTKILTGAKLTLPDFDANGRIITSIYERLPNQATTLVLQKTKGSGAYSSHYTAGSVNASIVVKHKRVVISEIIYKYEPLTAIKNFLNLVDFPDKIYEVTIY